MSKKIFFLKLIINVGVKLSEISMLKKELPKKKIIYQDYFDRVKISKKTSNF